MSDYRIIAPNHRWLTRGGSGVYRYKVANPGLRLVLNRYGWKVIGIALVVGRFAYCVKWARA